MAALFDVPDNKKIRVIVDTDAACEADDPFAIVHALISPKLIVKGITAEHYNEEGSVQKSYEEIRTILELMQMDTSFFMGEERALSSAEQKGTSEAVDFIIGEALREDEHPLYILCQGAITNIAAAFNKCPDIIDKVTVIWIGTHGEQTVAPFREFNAGNDIISANKVLSSGTNLWLVPSCVYTTITIGIAEIQNDVLPCGAIGRHLFENMISYNNSEFAGWTQGESWSLGDSPAIAIAINPGCGHFKEIEAPIICEDTSSKKNDGAKKQPSIRMYTDVDSRYVLGDFIAKLKLFTS